MIGVFGGTFDPVHLGHLRPALDVLQYAGLDQIRFVPLRVPVHRASPIADRGVRVDMLRAAIDDVAGFVLDERELHRGGASYSYDTLVSLRDELGSGAPICLMVGADAFNGFLDWYRPLDILQLAHLLVMGRPGTGRSGIGPLRELLLKRETDQTGDLRKSPAGRIVFQPVTQLDISSTQVRQLILEGRSVKFLVPDPVLEIIEQQGLYRKIAASMARGV